jgi:hypothetical protein
MIRISPVVPLARFGDQKNFVCTFCWSLALLFLGPRRKILAVAVAVMLGLATTGGAALARSGGFGGDHIGSGFRGGPYLGDTTSTPSPIFNPSSGYTVPTSPEAPVSPASPGSIFH